MSYVDAKKQQRLDHCAACEDHRKTISALRERIQKLESNMTHRAVDVDRLELECQCKSPSPSRNRSSDSGRKNICLNCCGWS